jgi:transposase
MSQYSNTLRKRVLEEIDKKVPKKLVSKQFSIHVNTINNWLKLRKKDENN